MKETKEPQFIKDSRWCCFVFTVFIFFLKVVAVYVHEINTYVCSVAERKGVGTEGQRGI